MKKRIIIFSAILFLVILLVQDFFFSGNYTTIIHPSSGRKLTLSLIDGGAISGDWRVLYDGEVSNYFDSYFSAEILKVQGYFQIGIDSTNFIVYCPDCKFTYNGLGYIIYVDNSTEFESKSTKILYP